MCTAFIVLLQQCHVPEHSVQYHIFFNLCDSIHVIWLYQYCSFYSHANKAL